MPMLLFLAAIISVCLAANQFLKASGESTTDTLYVLAYSWQAEFCYGTTYPGCKAPEEYWKTHFTLHGLWPQYVTSGYPSSCTTEAYDPKTADAIGMDTMVTYWPNVKASEGTPEYDDFWDHEWTKHGTCSGLKQVDYFNTTIALIQSYGTPSIVSNNVGKTVSTTDVRNSFGGSTKVSLQCTSGKYLVGAYTCWSQKNGYPTGQTTCPSDVQKEDTCTSTSVVIQSF